jgi:hypothetical protein
VGAVRVRDGCSPVPYVFTSFSMARARRDLRRGARLAGRPGAAVRRGQADYPAIRVEGRRGVVPGAGGRGAGERPADGRHVHAWPLDSAGLGRGWAGLARRLPALCINRCVGGRPGSLSGAPGASRPRGLAVGMTQFAAIRAGGHPATDRLVTPFNAFKAQSGPRKVSPMNFTGGSRSIQRLMTARPSDFGSRGRA